MSARQNHTLIDYKATRDTEYWMGEGVKGADYITTGKNGIESLATLKKNCEQHGIQVTMDVVPGAEHDETQLFPAVRNFLESELAKLGQGRLEMALRPRCTADPAGHGP